VSTYNVNNTVYIVLESSDFSEYAECVAAWQASFTPVLVSTEISVSSLI